MQSEAMQLPWKPRVFPLLLYTVGLFVALELALNGYSAFAIDVGTTPIDAFLVNFRDAEREVPEQGGYTFQWTRPESVVLTPGLNGLWEATIRLRQRPESPPASLRFQANGLDVTLNPSSGIHRYRLTLRDADSLRITSDVSRIADPELRQLGVAIDTITLTRKQFVPALHPSIVVLVPLFTLGLVWLAATAEMARRDALLVFGGGSAALLALAVRYPPYMLLLAPRLAVILALLLPVGFGLHRLLGRRAPLASGVPLACFVGLLVVKLSGAIFPAYLPTDTLFHGNRFTATIVGSFYTTAAGQGQVYPYPPGSYLFIAPLALLVSDLRWLIPIASIVVDATTVFLLVWLMRPYGRTLVNWACILYAVMPVAVLVHWQGGFTQSVGQWFGVAFVVALVVNVALRLQSSDFSRRPLALLLVLALVATTGHFGVLLNLGLMCVLLFGLMALRRLGGAWLALVLPVAAVVMLVAYYSAFGRLFVEQLAFLTPDAGAEPVSRLFLLDRFIWQLGLRDHYLGIFTVLALPPLFLLMPMTPYTRSLRVVLGAMLLTSLILGVLNVAVRFNGTRYMVFAYPAIAALAAFSLHALARRRYGWLLTRALVCFSVATCLVMWCSGVGLDARIGFLL